MNTDMNKLYESNIRKCEQNKIQMSLKQTMSQIYYVNPWGYDLLIILVKILW